VVIEDERTDELSLRGRQHSSHEKAADVALSRLDHELGIHGQSVA
jgi:hypothetical protein